MLDDSTIFIIGPALGTMVFLASTATMEGIFYRPTSEGKREFTLDIFKDYLKAPFKVGTLQFNTVWGKNMPIKEKLKMLQLNWVAMAGTGLAASALVVLGKRMLF